MTPESSGQLPLAPEGEPDQLALEAGEVINRARSRVREAAIGGPDEGYFPEGSTLRMVQASRVVGLLYGQLGLAMGGTDPLNYVGNSEHTRHKELPFGRFAETAEAFETIFFGTRDQADTVVDRVFLMHKRVRGETAQGVDTHPKGTPYAAFDPKRMLWTMACMAYPAVTLYETLEHPLSDNEREDFWQDYVLFGELFGLSPGDAPQTYPQFQQYMSDRFSSGELFLTDAAKDMGKEVCFNTPIPRFPALAREHMNRVLLGLLPEEIRELYDLEYGPREERAFQTTASAIRLGNQLLPKAVTRGDNSYFFKLVAKEEERLQGLGKQAVMQANPY
jgi:uncharacterized protein (DUF2236 family)